MDIKNFSKGVKCTLVQAPLASGTSDPASNYVDMSGYEGVCFVGLVGTAGTGATATLTVQDCTASTGTFANMSTGSAQVATTGGLDDKFLMVDVYRPRARYVKTKLTRGTSNVEYGGTIALQYGARKEVVTQSTSTIGVAAAFYHEQTT